MRRFTAALAGLVVVATGCSVAPNETKVDNVAAARVVEKLDRGTVAVPSTGGYLVSWRLLATDPQDVSFRLYRNGALVTTTKETNHLDAAGSGGVTYAVAAVVAGVEGPRHNAAAWNAGHKDIPLNKPAGGVDRDGVSYTYEANDASVGDLDGDGAYELVLKWSPTNASDVANSGKCTAPTVMDAYELDGTRKWRIGLGHNIRTGSHYTPFLVYDFDSDGKAEVAVRTSDGSKDADGKVIGSATADHRDPTSCAVLSGAEYLSVFNGESGKVMSSVAFEPARETVASWGDTWGNREGRLLATVAYLDGLTPSMVFTRGIYARSALAAYDWRDGKLTRRWKFDTNSSTNTGRGFDGQGYHNLAAGDVDGDGKDEIVYGAMTVDDDGSGRYTTKLGHGDAVHLGDFDPARQGLEVFGVHEEKGSAYGFEMHDASTGEILWGQRTGTDVGRGLCADLDRQWRGTECWSSGGGLYQADGTKISDVVPSWGGGASFNNAIWWDGDAHRELLDHRWSGSTGVGYGMVLKWNTGTKVLDRIWFDTAAKSNNWTKGNPSLQADILGDWREEMIWRNADSTALRLYSTPHPTTFRLVTLMQDPVYRLGVAWQNVGYNQFPETSFYLGTRTN